MASHPLSIRLVLHSEAAVSLLYSSRRRSRSSMPPTQRPNSTASLSFGLSAPNAINKAAVNRVKEARERYSALSRVSAPKQRSIIKSTPSLPVSRADPPSARVQQELLPTPSLPCFAKKPAFFAVPAPPRHATPFPTPRNRRPTKVSLLPGGINPFDCSDAEKLRFEAIFDERRKPKLDLNLTEATDDSMGSSRSRVHFSDSVTKFVFDRVDTSSPSPDYSSDVHSEKAGRTPYYRRTASASASESSLVAELAAISTVTPGQPASATSRASSSTPKRGTPSKTKVTAASLHAQLHQITPDEMMKASGVMVEQMAAIVQTWRDMLVRQEEEEEEEGMEEDDEETLQPLDVAFCSERMGGGPGIGYCRQLFPPL